MGLTIVSFIGCAMLLHALSSVNAASNRRCFPLNDGGSLCFTQPNPPVALSWYDALQRCKGINSTLPILNNDNQNRVYRNALGYFGLLKETMWLSANSTYDPSNWYWGDGTRFTGTIESRNIQEKTHAYVTRKGTSTKFVAASPFESKHYICRETYSEQRCANSYYESYWTDDSCYTKHRFEQSWYSFRSRCEETIPASYSDVMKFSRWLDDSRQFWVDLSCSRWTWQDIVVGITYAVVEKQFGSNLPDGTSNQCLASYRTSSGDIEWRSLNCYGREQFICQQYVNRSSTTSDITTARMQSSYSSSKQSANTSTVPNSSIGSNSVNSGLANWIGVGLCGGLFLTATIWLALITVYARRQIRDATHSLIQLPRQSDTDPVVISSTSCNDYAFEVESGIRDKGADAAEATYESLELQAKEQLYQPIEIQPKRLAKAKPRFT